MKLNIHSMHDSIVCTFNCAQLNRETTKMGMERKIKTRLLLLYFCCCDKLPQQSNLGEKQACFSLEFQVISHPCGEAKIETLNSYSHHSHNQEKREMNPSMLIRLLVRSLAFPIFSSLGSSPPKKWCCSQWAGSSHTS